MSGVPTTAQLLADLSSLTGVCSTFMVALTSLARSTRTATPSGGTRERLAVAPLVSSLLALSRKRELIISTAIDYRLAPQYPFPCARGSQSSSSCFHADARRLRSRRRPRFLPLPHSPTSRSQASTSRPRKAHTRWRQCRRRTLPRPALPHSRFGTACACWRCVRASLSRRAVRSADIPLQLSSYRRGAASRAISARRSFADDLIPADLTHSFPSILQNTATDVIRA